MNKPVHSFKVGDTIYLMLLNNLMVGEVVEANGYDQFNWYVPIKLKKGGSGCPAHTSLHKTKESAVNTWYNEQRNELETKILKLSLRRKKLLR